MVAKNWKCLNKKYVVSNKWMKVRKDSILLPNGTRIDDYYVIEKNNVALIMAVTPDSKVIVKKEYRYPIKEELLEIPGGTFDANKESPLEAAKRELLEETGYATDKWEEVGELYDYPTKDTNKIHIFLARDVKKVAEQNLDSSEDIEYDFINIEKIENMIMEGDIKVSGSIATLLIGMKRLKNLEK